MTTNKQKALEAMYDKGGYLTCQQVAELAGITQAQARDVMDRLITAGDVEWKRISKSARNGQPATAYRLLIIPPVGSDAAIKNVPIGMNQVMRLRPLSGNPFAGLMV